MSLGKIGAGNPKAIEALLELLRNSQNEFTRWQVIRSLGQIGIGNPKVIEGLRELLHTRQSAYTRSLAEEILGKIDSFTDGKAQGVEDNKNPAGNIFVQAEKTVRPATTDEIP